MNEMRCCNNTYWDETEMRCYYNTFKKKKTHMLDEYLFSLVIPPALPLLARIIIGKQPNSLPELDRNLILPLPLPLLNIVVFLMSILYCICYL